MKRVLHCAILILVFLCSSNAQNPTDVSKSMEGKWQFLHIQNAQGVDILPVAAHDTFVLNTNGQFAYHLKAKNNLYAKGRWAFANDTLTLHYAAPTDTLRYYHIVLSETGDTLCLHESGIDYCFHRGHAKQLIDTVAAPSGGKTLVNGFLTWRLVQIFLLMGMCIPFLICLHPLFYISGTFAKYRQECL